MNSCRKQKLACGHGSGGNGSCGWIVSKHCTILNFATGSSQKTICCVYLASACIVFTTTSQNQSISFCCFNGYTFLFSSVKSDPYSLTFVLKTPRAVSAVWICRTGLLTLVFCSPRFTLVSWDSVSFFRFSVIKESRNYVFLSDIIVWPLT